MKDKYMRYDSRRVNKDFREYAVDRNIQVKQKEAKLSREEIIRRRRAAHRRLKEKQRKQRIVLTIVAVVGLLFLWMIYILGSFIWGLIFQGDQVDVVEEDTAIVEDANIVVPTELTYLDLPYAREDYLERYEIYGQENLTLSVEDVVTHTNMGIDVPFFTRDAIQVQDSAAIDVLVNKVYSLSVDYEPSDLMIVENSRSTTLRKEAGEAFINMQKACKELGFDIVAVSGYRTYAYQEMVYNNKVESSGVEMANKYVSKPGHSEHSTGLAVDIGINGTDYNGISNSEYYPTFYSMLSDYGFIVRYPEGKEELTGYNYEAWHMRYLGIDVAKAVMESGLTYDEYVARLY